MINPPDDLEYENVVSLLDAKVQIPLAGFIVQLAKAKSFSEARALREIILAGASRVAQLYRYNEKKKLKASTFRPYAPLKLDASTRGDLKRAAKAAGIAPEKKDPRKE